MNYTNRKASKINVDAFLYDEITYYGHKSKSQSSDTKSLVFYTHAYQSFYSFPNLTHNNRKRHILLLLLRREENLHRYQI